MNPSFDAIGNTFAQHYYKMFDDKATRETIGGMYHPTEAMLTFEGQQYQGVDAIQEKLKALPIDSMLHQLTTIDCQPTTDGGVLVNVVGQLKSSAENDKPMGFNQTFVLKPGNNSFFIHHDIFRLALHNS